MACLCSAETGLGLWCLPKEVLFKIIGQAAAEVGTWMSGAPVVSRTEGLPEKPIELEKLVQQHHQG